MNSHCLSCGMPISGEDGKDRRGDYCLYCTDESGNLYPRQVVQKGVAEWLKQFGPQDPAIDYMQRADLYLSAMPAWAQL
ncbi:hypothetical protein JW935_14190 [candidate division KSB1 bacterium]|nr:hypothetical protein [candidate division KSB1 bacterium]